MAKQLTLLDVQKYLRFFWAIFLCLILSLFFLEGLFLLSMSHSEGSFSSYWFSEKQSVHALGIVGVFVLGGVVLGAWFNSKYKLGFMQQEVVSLKEMVQAKIDFISFVSHEVRSPVTALRYMLQILLDEKLRGSLSKDQVSMLTKAYNAAEDLNSLVSEFLDTSKIESAKLELLVKRVELSNLVTHITNIGDELQPLLESKKITLDIQTPLDQGKAVAVDAPRIFQVVRNLFQNAINYTPEKGKITVVLKTSPAEFQFSITDSGIGIPKTEQDKIFNKYFRAVNARMTHSSGTGLGLFLCKKLIEGHQGKIWFISEENQGTTFTFTIPLRTSPATEDLFRKI